MSIGKILGYGAIGFFILAIAFNFFTLTFNSPDVISRKASNVIFVALMILGFACGVCECIFSPKKKKRNQDHEKIISFIDNNKNKQQQLNNRYRQTSKNYKKHTANRINSFEKNSNIKQMDLPEELNGNLPHSDLLKEKFGNWDCSSQEMYLAMNYAYNLGYDTGYNTGYNHGYSAGSTSHH